MSDQWDGTYGLPGKPSSRNETDLKVEKDENVLKLLATVGQGIL